MSRRGLAAVLLSASLASSGLSCKSASPEGADTPSAAPAPPANGHTEAAPPMERGRVTVPGGRTFSVEVVQDPRSRERGLQNRAALPAEQGMVFVFPSPGRYKFWMYECLIPLDIIWMDADRTVIDVEENLPFCKAQPCPDYGPDRDAQYVLELGAGVAKPAGIHPGARLTILFDHPPNPR